MFEYKGSQFTLDQIEQRAKEKGLTLQEYLSANPEITEIAQEKPIEEVKTTPVVPDAVAGEEIASDMELPSDPGSLDSPKITKPIAHKIKFGTPLTTG